MDLSKLIQHVEELIYQVVVLLVLIPKTLRRVVSDVDWFRSYVAAESSKQFGDSAASVAHLPLSQTDPGIRAKIAIAHRLKLRIDYRVFLLGDTPDAARGFGVYRHPHRVSAGLSVAF